jgi:hypothetical protein
VLLIDAALTARYTMRAMRCVCRAEWVAGLLMGLCVSRASVARAAEIDWHGPPACPDAEELRFRVERAIGMPLSHAADLHFEVTAEAARQAYVASVELEASPGVERRHRSLIAPDCSRLVDLVSVTVAIALGATQAELDGPAPSLGDLGSPGAAPSPSDAPLPATAASGSDDSLPSLAEARTSVVPDSTASASWRPAASIWFVGDTGSLPHVGTGVALGAQLGRNRFALLALATLLFEQHAASAVPAASPAAVSEPGADLGLITGALAACGLPFGSHSSRFRAQGCAGWELGRLSGKGTGVQRPRAGAALWSAPRLDAGASWGLGVAGLRLAASLTLALPLTRDEFTLGDVGSVHRPPAAVARFAIGLNVDLK